MAHPTKDFLTRDACGEPREFTPRQSAAVCECIAEREFGIRHRIGQAEPGNEGRQTIVPTHLPVRHEHRHQRSRERFAARPDLEERSVVDRHARADLLHAVTLRVQDRVVPDDGHGETGDLPVCHCLRHVRVPARKRLLGRQAIGENGRAKDGEPEDARRRTPERRACRGLRLHHDVEPVFGLLIRSPPLHRRFVLTPTALVIGRPAVARVLPCFLLDR